MEIREIRNNLPLLHSLYKCPGNSERNILFSHLDDNSFKFICGWLKKCVNDPSFLNLPNRKLTHLRHILARDKNRITKLTKAGKVTTTKRKAVRQSGEGIGILLSVLAPVLISLVKDLVTKKKK